jgi:sugar/nucleoside kinase (ribokinase family)
MPHPKRGGILHTYRAAIMPESPEFVPDYLFIGHIAHDVTPEGPRLGGTVSYGAHTAMAMGQQVGILTSAKPGEPLLADLPIDAHVVSIPAEHTTTFENRYVGSVRTQYMYHRALTLTPTMLPPAWRRARLIHIAPIAYEIDPAFFTLFEEGAICVTPQGFMRSREPDGLVKTVHWADAERALSRTRLTVFSEEDIRHDPGLEKTFARFAPLAVLTRAERGGTVYRGDTVFDFAAIEVEQVGPTGAGDVFATALHIALDRLGDLERAIQVAAYLAGRSITREGFDSAPTPDEIAAAWDMVGVIP